MYFTLIGREIKSLFSDQSIYIYIYIYIDIYQTKSWQLPGIEDGIERKVNVALNIAFIKLFH